MSRGTSDRTIAVDHLVVACRTLDAGHRLVRSDPRRQSRARRPAPADGHAQPAAVDRVGGAFRSAYLEIIAIDPEAPRAARPRWFDLDEAALQAALVESAPRSTGSRAATIVARPSPTLAVTAIDPGDDRRRRADDAARPAALADHACRPMAGRPGRRRGADSGSSGMAPSIRATGCRRAACRSSCCWSAPSCRGRPRSSAAPLSAPLNSPLIARLSSPRGPLVPGGTARRRGSAPQAPGADEPAPRRAASRVVPRASRHSAARRPRPSEQQRSQRAGEDDQRARRASTCGRAARARRRPAAAPGLPWPRRAWRSRTGATMPSSSVSCSFSSRRART